MKKYNLFLYTTYFPWKKHHEVIYLFVVLDWRDIILIYAIHYMIIFFFFINRLKYKLIFGVGWILTLNPLIEDKKL